MMSYVLVATASGVAGLIIGFLIGVSAEHDRIADIMLQDIVADRRRRKAGYGRISGFAYPEFLEVRELSPDGDTLRRADLGILRCHVDRIRDPLPYPEGLHLIQTSLIRLLAVGMIEEHWNVKQAPETYITAFGLETVGANANCMDDAEDLPLSIGRRRGDFEKILAIVITYETALALAMADVLEPHPPTDSNHPLAVSQAAHEVGFGAAVVDWVRQPMGLLAAADVGFHAIVCRCPMSRWSLAEEYRCHPAYAQGLAEALRIVAAHSPLHRSRWTMQGGRNTRRRPPRSVMACSVRR